MGKYRKQIADLIRQTRPTLARSWDTDEEVVTCVAGIYIYQQGYDFPDGETTIEELERRKAEGYGTLINDGKLIGFIKEAP